MEEKVHEKGNFVAVENIGTVVVAVYTGQVICVHGSAEGPKEKEREGGISFQSRMLLLFWGFHLNDQDTMQAPYKHFRVTPTRSVKDRQSDEPGSLP